MSKVQNSLELGIIDILTGQVSDSMSTNFDTFSPNFRYVAQINSNSNDNQFVTIFDRETNSETELHNPFIELVTLDEGFIELARTYWSSDSQFLTVLYRKLYTSDNSDYNLVIYTSSGEIFRQYKNMKIFQQNPWASIRPYRILLRGEAGTLCILEVVENDMTCLDFFTEWKEMSNVVIFNALWSPIDDQISFVYAHSDELSGGLCYIELASENILCPIQENDIQSEERLFARLQFWSNDGRYLVVFLDTLGFRDVVGPQYVAIVDIESQDIHILDGKFDLPFTNPWRPSFQSEE